MANLLRRAIRKILGYQSWNSDDDQQRLLAGAKTIFDVGANIGQTARAYRRLFPTAHIWSFEPFPECYETLCSAIPGQAFHPVRLGLSDETTSALLNVGAASTTNSLLQRSSSTGATIEIQIDTVDRFCSEHNISVIDILKIDVEGAESRVLNGAKTMFSLNAVRSVFLEVYFDPVYEGMPLMWDLHSQLCGYGFYLHGLYSLNAGSNGRLSYGNALYLQAK